jgi:hypothetical protein
MQTRKDCTVRVLGEPPWRELDCSTEPLSDEMRVLLWVIDGAERRQRIAATWHAEELPASPSVRPSPRR